VEIELKNGETHSAYCEYPKGDPENPLSETELIEKFEKLCGNILTESEKRRTVDFVLSLEKIDDVAHIFHG
jgi:2-methylcitrate dehydratase PrpD